MSIKCPITKMIYLYPVIADDGYIYEDIAINSWLLVNNVSPITGHHIKKVNNIAKNMEKYINKIIKLYPELEDRRFPISYYEQNTRLKYLYVYDKEICQKNKLRRIIDKIKKSN